MHRLLAGSALVRAHQKFTRRYDHHVRAVGAIAEDVPWHAVNRGLRPSNQRDQHPQNENDGDPHRLEILHRRDRDYSSTLWHPFRAKPVPWVPLGPARRHINPHNARVKAARVLCDAHKIYLKDSRANWLRHVRYLVKRGLWVLTAEQVREFIRLRGSIEALAAWDILEARRSEGGSLGLAWPLAAVVGRGGPFDTSAEPRPRTTVAAR